MKKLQNNFTTPEQSKRLLELGLPADSADCYYCKFEKDTQWGIPNVLGIEYSKHSRNIGADYFPCWSVGRLIEIYEICVDNNHIWSDFASDIRNLVERLIYDIESMREINGIKFSKLEE